MSLIARWLALLAVLLGPNAADAAATAWVGDDHAAARLITAVQASGAAGEIDAALQIRLAAGWHAYWRSPGDAGFAPSLGWSGSGNLKSAQIYWPAPKRFLLDGLVTQGYETGVALPVAVAVAQPGQPVLLRALVHYAACKDICVPHTAQFSLALPAGMAVPGPEAPLIAAAWQSVPVSPAEAGLRVASVLVSAVDDPAQGAVLSVVVETPGKALARPDLFIEGLPGATPGAPESFSDAQHHRAVLGVFLRNQQAAALAGMHLQFTLEGGAAPVTFSAAPVVGPLPARPGAGGGLRIILIALLGGLVLNVMPCVLPVLSLKLFGLVGASGLQRRQVRFNLLASAAGVVASFLLIALVLILLRAAGAAIGWGIQFQQPWFLAGMAVVTTLFAANLWDFFAISMPGFGQRAAAVGVAGHPAAEAFLTGAFATLLATSCSAPFVGTAVGFALARDPGVILGIFAALGAGMALPYLAVAAAPGLVRALPRPGAWMVKLRAALGLALLGTAGWLVWVMASVVSVPAAMVLGVILLALLAVLFARARMAGVSRLLAMAVVMLALAGTLAPSLLRPAPPAAADPVAASVFQPFDETRIAGLVAQNRIVFVDVTAAWCLVCKVNAATVLGRNPVAARLRAPVVVAMRADWTRPSPAITDYLESFHRYGVPLDVVYGPGAPSGILLPSLLTPGAVMEALHHAGETKPDKPAQSQN